MCRPRRDVVRSRGDLSAPAPCRPAPHARRAARLRARLAHRQGRGARQPARAAAQRRGSASPASSASTTRCCRSCERALLAGHDLVLLGERGQGKTRLIRTLVGLLDEWTPVRRRLRDQRPSVRAGDSLGAAAGRRARRRSAGRVAAPQRRATARSSRRRTPPSATSSATSTRSRSPRAAPSATPRRCTTAWCRGPTAASSPSTSCPTSPSASRCRCSTCSRSATSRCAATSCGCRSTCCSSRARTPRTTPTAVASSPRSRTASAPRSARTTRCGLDDEIALVAAGGDARRDRCRTTCSRSIARFTRLVRESPAVDAPVGCLGALRVAGDRDRRRLRAAPRGAHR